MALSPNTAWEVDGAAGNDANGGGFIAGATGTDKTYSTGQAAVLRSDLAITPIGAPAAPTVANSGSGGTVAANTYYVVITYVSYNGTTGAETTASPQASTTTTGTTSTITVTSPAAAVGATHYQVYTATTSGGPYDQVTGTTANGTPIGTALTIAATPPTSGTTPPAADKSYVNVTSGTAFAASDVGNTIQVASGTGWTTGFYQVVNFDATSGKATLDRTPTAGVAPGGNGTGTLGGALATLKTAVAKIVGSNKVFVKATAAQNVTGSASISVNVAPGDGQSGTAPPTRVLGYDQSRGDIVPRPAGGWTNNANRPVVLLGVNGTLNFYGNGVIVENLVVNGQGNTGTGGIIVGAYATVRNCLVENCATGGISLGSNGAVVDCEVTGCASGAVAIHCNAGAVVANCHVHDNACAGIYAVGGSAVVLDCLIANNTGATSDGLQVGANVVVVRNTIRGNGRDGLSVQNHSNYGDLYRDNILASNGRYGFYGALAQGIAATPSCDGNAYYQNTTAARANADDTTTNPINGVAPYTNALDVTLTANPFVADGGAGSATTTNFALNATAGGGAACKGAGTPQVWALAAASGGTTATSSAPSLGAAQPSPAAVAGGVSRSRTLGD